MLTVVFAFKGTGNLFLPVISSHVNLKIKFLLLTKNFSLFIFFIYK